MDKWDKRFLDLAQLVAGWSKDPSTGVGAVIVDEKNRIVSVGFNGLPRGVPDKSSYLDDREIKLQIILHAEENALIFAERPVVGCTCYVWPLPPCAKCASKLIQFGISRVVAPYPKREHWKDSSTLGKRLFIDVGVQLDLMMDYEG